MWSQHRTLARMNSVIVMTRCLGKMRHGNQGGYTPLSPPPALKGLLKGQCWLMIPVEGLISCRAGEKRGGYPLDSHENMPPADGFFASKDEIHQSVNLFSIWLHFVSVRNEETNCYSRPVVVFFGFHWNKKKLRGIQSPSENGTGT